MRGQILVSHIVMVSAVLVSLVLVFMVFMDVTNNFKERISNSLAEKVLTDIENSVYDICLISSDLAGGNVSYFVFENPEKIVGRRYRVILEDNKIILNLGAKNYTRYTNLPCKLDGIASPPLKIVYNSEKNILLVSK